LKHNISAIRNDYKKYSLDVDVVGKDPIAFFERWMDEAIHSEIKEPTAMTLATASPEGQPSSRMVLLKGILDGSFVFFTNYQSQKGEDLAANPKAAVTFFWPELERQVNITGWVKKANDTYSDEYFHSRPRKYQVGAWASKQSQVLSSRAKLMADFAALTLKYVGRSVPRPPHWGGYQLIPDSIEFWQGRESRLHDRIQFQRNNNSWDIARLSP
jgi:pyridoxamine 5'-phosphate oxidase